MQKESIKNYGLVLFAIAGVIVIGLASYWKFTTWRIVDWFIIVIVSYIGYKLYNYK